MNWLKKILGLDLQEQKLDEIYNALQKEVKQEKPVLTNFEIVDSLDISKKLFSFEITNKSFPSVKKTNLNANDILGNIGSSLPNLVGNGLLANSYRFKYPKGIIGEVMRIRDGQGTAIMQNGKIIAHGTYVSNILVAAPLLAYNIGGIIIKQHCLAKINANLDEINKQLDQLLELEFIKKHAKIESIISFFEQAHVDFNLIDKNQNYKNAILTNIVKCNIEIIELIQFYKKSMKFIDNKKTNENGLNLKYFLALHTLYYQGKLLEFKYAAEYNKDMINNLKTALEKLTNESSEFLNLNKSQINEELNKISTNMFDMVLFRKKNKEELKSNLSNTKLVVEDLIENQKIESENIINSLNQFNLEISRRQEFLIENGELYEVIN